MNKPESNIQQTIDLLIGVIPTLILYGNFLLVGMIFGMKDILKLNNPIDEIFLISLGGILGLSGLVLSFGKTSRRVYLIVTSILITIGVITACYVVYSLYTEPDSPDSLFEKITILPLFGSIIVGLKRIYSGLFGE